MAAPHKRAYHPTVEWYPTSNCHYLASASLHRSCIAPPRESKYNSRSASQSSAVYVPNPSTHALGAQYIHTHSDLAGRPEYSTSDCLHPLQILLAHPRQPYFSSQAGPESRSETPRHHRKRENVKSKDGQGARFPQDKSQFHCNCCELHVAHPSKLSKYHPPCANTRAQFQNHPPAAPHLWVQSPSATDAQSPCRLFWHNKKSAHDPT